MRSILEIRKDFPILSQSIHGRDLIYLDSAATMQMPQPVLETVIRHYQNNNANVHRGAYALSQRATRGMEEARAAVCHFLRARSSKEIVFTSGTTGSINLLARALPLKPGDEVVATEMEHHSNYLPWQEACRRAGAHFRIVPVGEDGQLDLTAYRQILSSKTRLVAVSMVSNVLGTVNPVEEMTQLAHEVGALVAVYAAQGVRHGIDVSQMDCDFLAFSGHKVGALTGIGILYGRSAILEALPLWDLGGGMVAEVGPECSTYGAIPQRLEAGTPHYVGAISLGAALNYLEREDVAEIAAYETKLLAALERELTCFPEIHILGHPAVRTGAISFWVEGCHCLDVGMLLDAQGIAVRTGHHCAQPLLRRFGLDGVVRVSPAFYNTEAEMNTFCKALKHAITILKGISL